MSEQGSSSFPSQKRKSGVLSLAAKFEQQQDPAPLPSFSLKGRTRKASVSSPFNSFGSNGRDSSRFPSPSAFLEKANSFLKKPLPSPTTLRKVNIPKSFSSNPDLEKSAPNKFQPGKLADLSTTTTMDEFSGITRSINSKDVDDELSSTPELKSNFPHDTTKVSNFTSTTRTLEPNSSDALEDLNDNSSNLVKNSLPETENQAEHELINKQAEPLLSKLSHLSSPTIDSALPVDQASEHALESTSSHRSSHSPTTQDTIMNGMFFPPPN